MKYLLALRPVNLIIIGLLQWIFYHRFIFNLSVHYKLESLFSGHRIIFFILVSMFLAASGYLINDYIDFQADISNNKSHRLSSRSTILSLYFATLIPAYALAYYLAWIIGNPLLSIIFILAAAALFWYAIKLKGTSIYGNLLVAIFCTLGIVIIPMSEYRLLSQIKAIDPSQYGHTLSIFIAYSAFAFLLTMLREVVKDIEDIEGDHAFGLKTFPIVHGIPRAKILAVFNGVMLFAFMIICTFYFPAFRQNVYLVIGSALISFLILILMILLYFAQSKNQYSRISTFSKIIMLAGICYLINLPWT